MPAEEAAVLAAVAAAAAAPAAEVVDVLTGAEVVAIGIETPPFDKKEINLNLLPVSRVANIVPTLVEVPVSDGKGRCVIVTTSLNFLSSPCPQIKRRAFVGVALFGIHTSSKVEVGMEGEAGSSPRLFNKSQGIEPVSKAIF